ncbi:MAG: hypothetical protein ACSW8E_03045 [Clostridia bacterium]
MKKRFLFWIIPAILILLFAVFFLLPGTGRTAKVLSAALYVNGERTKMPAIMFWYDDYQYQQGQSPLLGFPLYETLEKLGCQVERKEQKDAASATVRVGSRVFEIKENSYACDLYENDRLIYTGIAKPTFYGGRGVKGQQYLNKSLINEDFENMLTVLGFEQITVEIDVKEKTVRLSATK